MKLHTQILIFICLTSVSQLSFAQRQHEHTTEIQEMSPGPILVTDRKGNVEMKHTEEVSQALAVRPEHLELNVSDSKAVVRWYSQNLGMKIVRQAGPPAFTAFIADSDMNMMLEITHSASDPCLDFGQVHHMSLHLAFMVDDIAGMKVRLLSAGATLVEEISKTPSDDLVLMLRDPWGLPIQFAQRVKPMLRNTGVRAEHLAVNVIDAKAKAQWYADNLGMKIVRQGSAPTFGTFVTDSSEHMMFEIYQDTRYPVMDFSKVSHMAIHFASMVPDVDVAKVKLLAAGATVAADVSKTPAGDDVVTLRDPWGFPIQFVSRVEPMLK